MSGFSFGFYNFVTPYPVFDRCKHCRKLHNPNLPTAWNKVGFCSRDCSVIYYANKEPSKGGGGGGCE